MYFFTQSISAKYSRFGDHCICYNSIILLGLFCRHGRTNGDPPVRALHTVEEICNCKWYNRPKYFNGTVDALLKISRTEGVQSLWSGLSPTLVLAVPTTMIYFTTYEQLKAVMHTRYTRYHSVIDSSGLTSHGETSPVEPPPWISLASGEFEKIVF